MEKKVKSVSASGKISFDQGTEIIYIWALKKKVKSVSTRVKDIFGQWALKKKVKLVSTREKEIGNLYSYTRAEPTGNLYIWALKIKVKLVLIKE